MPERNWAATTGLCQIGLLAASDRDVRVLRATRCLDGSIVEGGASTLPSGADLTPAKARVELILTLLAERRGRRAA